MKKHPDKRRKPSVPKLFVQTRADHIRTLTKATLQNIPFGGTLAELYNVIFGSPITDRRDEFLYLVLHNIEDLRETVQGFNPYNLAENEAFKSTFLHAIEVAIRTHQEEKKEALKNAVLNSALPGSIDDNLQLMFLKLLDGFSPWHLKILGFIKNPEEWVKNNNPTTNFQEDWKTSRDKYPGYYIVRLFPDLKDEDIEFCNQVVKDLETNGLVYVKDVSHLQNIPGLRLPGNQPVMTYYAPPEITNYGILFLLFIEEPKKFI